VKYLLFYRSGPDVKDKAPLHFAAHQSRWAGYRDAGTLLMIGTYSDLSGALAVFRTREAAEEFATGDPFVLNGVVESWEIVEWREALAG
jgi:uncharacterized protein